MRIKLREALSWQIRASLNRQNMTQRELAELTGFSEQHISQMLTGAKDGSLEAWDALANSLDYSWASETAENRLREEIAEYADLTGRLARLLTATANALKGEPPDTIWHDWSDLPEVARRLTQEPD